FNNCLIFLIFIFLAIFLFFSSFLNHILFSFFNSGITTNNEFVANIKKFSFVTFLTGIFSISLIKLLLFINLFFCFFFFFFLFFFFLYFYLSFFSLALF